MTNKETDFPSFDKEILQKLQNQNLFFSRYVSKILIYNECFSTWKRKLVLGNFRKLYWMFCPFQFI